MLLIYSKFWNTREMFVLQVKRKMSSWNRGGARPIEHSLRKIRSVKKVESHWSRQIEIELSNNLIKTNTLSFRPSVYFRLVINYTPNIWSRRKGYTLFTVFIHRTILNVVRFQFFYITVIIIIFLNL